MFISFNFKFSMYGKLHFVFFIFFIISVELLFVFGLTAVNSINVFPPNLYFINPLFFCFSVWVIVFIFHDLKYQILFQYLLQFLGKCLLFLSRPCSIILLFVRILFSLNRTQINLLFYWFLVLINLNRLFYS